MFSHVPVHFAILLGFSICLGGGGAGGGDAVRLCFFAAGFFGGAAGMRSSVAPLLMFVILKAGAFLAAGLREGHCGGAPPLLPPYMLALLSTQTCAPQLVPSAAMPFLANECLLPSLLRHTSSLQALARAASSNVPENRLRGACFSRLLAACKDTSSEFQGGENQRTT